MKKYRMEIVDMRNARTASDGRISGVRQHKVVEIGPMKRADAERVLAATRAGLPKGFAASVSAAI